VKFVGRDPDVPEVDDCCPGQTDQAYKARRPWTPSPLPLVTRSMPELSNDDV
jgi:hypothetical protein